MANVFDWDIAQDRDITHPRTMYLVSISDLLQDTDRQQQLGLITTPIIHNYND